MSTVGIIAEYNPFHTGHAYQIAEARKRTGADHVLVIMSGNFVQRGAPAIMDKYSRTRLALEGGADYVLELPVWMAAASAADFAEGGVSILDALNCVDYLCFGSEAGELPRLKEAAALFLEEPPAFQDVLRQQLSAGKSFPKARKIAWEAVTQTSGDFLDLPNNILGISYLMALEKRHSTIQPVTISRQGSFHNQELDGNFASASALRKQLLEHACTVENACTVKNTCTVKHSCIVNDTCTLEHHCTGTSSESFPEKILPYLSNESACQWMKQEYGRSYPMDTSHFWPVLKTQLLSKAEYAEEFADMPKELVNRLKSCYFSCNSYEELAESLKTAAFTRSRIDRCLLHILLDIRQSDVNWFKENGTAFYARLLGFRKNHAELLKELTTKSQIPVLTKALPPENLSAPAAASYALDTKAANLYESIRGISYPTEKPMHEYRKKLIVV